MQWLTSGGTNAQDIANGTVVRDQNLHGLEAADPAKRTQTELIIFITS